MIDSLSEIKLSKMLSKNLNKNTVDLMTYSIEIYLVKLLSDQIVHSPA